MKLSEFLLARIAEDEAEARQELADGYGDLHRCESGWPSGRVLTECIVKRELLAMSEREVRIQKLLAWPYADHPDYDEEWRP